jgi:hypothetical protein
MVHGKFTDHGRQTTDGIEKVEKRKIRTVSGREHTLTQTTINA